MSMRRWRVRTLVGVVVLAALVFKGVRMIQESPYLAARRFRALHELASRRPPPASAKPTFLKALDDSNEGVRNVAVWGLKELGSTDPEYIRLLVERLETETDESLHMNRWDYTHVDPTQALVQIKPPADLIAPLLRKAMASPDPTSRLRATEVLAEVAKRRDPPCPALAELLLAALRDKELLIRAWAAEGLAWLEGDTKRKAVEILLEQLRQKELPGQLLAVIGLSHFDPEGRAGATLLVDRIRGGDLTSRRQDVFLLGRLGPVAIDSVPAIVREMTSPDTEQYLMFFGDVFRPSQKEWHWAELERIELNGVQTLNTLVGMGAFALGRIGPEADRQAIALLLAMIQGKDGALGMRAARALGALGTRATEAIPLLLSLAERKACTQPGEDEFAAEYRLVQALGKVCTGGDAQFVAFLIRMLKTSEPTKRCAAASALSTLWPPAPSAVPALIDALKDEIQGVRFSAAVALGRYDGAERDAAVPALLETLRDDDESVRCSAAAALAHLGAGAAQAVPVAVKVLEDRHSTLRWKAVGILAAFGPNARSAIPALEKARQDEKRFVRDASEKALKAIAPPEAAKPVD